MFSKNHIPSFLKKYKEVWNYSPYLICCMIFEENISYAVFYYLTKFYYLIAFTSWDIE